MTETVHDLPLIMGEASESKAVFKDIGFVVNKVVTDANHWNQKKRTDSSKKIGKVWFPLFVNRIGCYSYKKKQ